MIRNRRAVMGGNREEETKPAHDCDVMSFALGKRSRCSEPYDCGTCHFFQQAYPDASWICAECRSRDLHFKQATFVAGHYQEGDCSLCGKHSSFLQALVEE
jgi:hypothetical protein